MRNIIIAIGLFFALCTAALAVQPENTVEARNLNQFTKEYQQAFETFTLEKLETAKRGMSVKWLGVVTDVVRTGNHFTIKPVLSSTKDADWYVFVRAELKSGKSVATCVKVGQLVIVDGTISSVNEGSAIVIAKCIYPEKPSDKTTLGTANGTAKAGNP